MRRRSLLRRVAAGAALLGTAGSGAVGNVAATDGVRERSEHVGTVDTRGHFEIEWNWSFWDGGVREVVLQPGHSKYDYDTTGTIPGMNAPAPDDLVVVAHGWNAEGSEAELTFDVAAGGLTSEGIAVPVVGFTYDADSLPTDWWETVELARRNGFKLANFLSDYRKASPGVTVRLWGHSLGAQVALSTLRVLESAGMGDLVDSTGLFGAAVNDEAVATDGTYGPTIAGTAGEVHNYHSERDEVLKFGYGVAEWSQAVGLVGAEGETPANYTDHDVTGRVPNHLAYFDPDDPDEGCAPIVAEEW